MQEKRKGTRHIISFPIRVKWKDDKGQMMTQEGLTENIGPHGTLVYLPRTLPPVGNKVELTITEDPEDEISVSAQVIRVMRNPAHPQAALQLTDSKRLWQKKVFQYAGEVLANEEPEGWDDWN